MKRLLFGAFAALSVACEPIPIVQPPPPPAPNDASCQSVCEHFGFLGCSEAQPTPGGTSCVEVCEIAQEGPAPLDLGCILRAQTCAGARKCE